MLQTMYLVKLISVKVKRLCLLTVTKRRQSVYNILIITKENSNPYIKSHQPCLIYCNYKM